MDDETEIEVSPAQKAVQYALNGDATNFKNEVDAMLYTKVADAIAVKQHDIASSMFGDETIGDVADEPIGGEDEDEDLDDDIELEPEVEDSEEPETEEESDEEL